MLKVVLERVYPLWAIILTALPITAGHMVHIEEDLDCW